MTDAIELANKIVALGVGERFGIDDNQWIYSMHCMNENVPADQFTKDARVVCALMELCLNSETIGYNDFWSSVLRHYNLSDNNSWREAIVMAAVEALG